MGVLHLDLKKEIISTCLRLQEIGYVLATYGNVSARVERGLIITPSRVAYRSLTPEDMVTVSYEGKIIEGPRQPSSELEVHRQIYLARPDVDAVVHTHSLFATALSCRHETIPVIVEEQSQVVGGEIHCTSYVPAGQHKKLGEAAVQALGRSNGVLLANHGAVSCGRSLPEAVLTCQIVERVAQIRLLAGTADKAIPIPEEFVRSERERWLYKYGTAEDRAAEEPGPGHRGRIED